MQMRSGHGESVVGVAADKLCWPLLASRSTLMVVVRQMARHVMVGRLYVCRPALVEGPIRVPLLPLAARMVGLASGEGDLDIVSEDRLDHIEDLHTRFRKAEQLGRLMGSAQESASKKEHSHNCEARQLLCEQASTTPNGSAWQETDLARREVRREGLIILDQARHVANRRRRVGVAILRSRLHDALTDGAHLSTCKNADVGGDEGGRGGRRGIRRGRGRGRGESVRQGCGFCGCCSYCSSGLGCWCLPRLLG